MAAKAQPRAIISSFEVEPELLKRMRANIQADANLRHVAPGRKRCPWIREAIEEKCERQERERAKAGQ